MTPRDSPASHSMPSLCSSPPETPRRPSPGGTCAGSGCRGGHLGSRCGSCQVAEKHSRCAGPPEPSAPARKKTSESFSAPLETLCHPSQVLRGFLFSDKEGGYGQLHFHAVPEALGFQVPWLQEQQKHSAGSARAGRIFSKSVTGCIRPHGREGSRATDKSQ